MTTELDIWRKTFDCIYERNGFTRVDDENNRFIYCYSNNTVSEHILRPDTIDWLQLVLHEYVWKAEDLFDDYISYKELYIVVPEAAQYIEPVKVLLV